MSAGKKKERDKEEMISYAVKKKKNVLAHFLILPVFNFSEIDCQQPQFIGIHGKESSRLEHSTAIDCIQPYNIFSHLLPVLHPLSLTLLRRIISSSKAGVHMLLPQALLSGKSKAKTLSSKEGWVK